MTSPSEIQTTDFGPSPDLGLVAVDDFTLMKESAHLLSAGVQLTAADFGTLGSAAFILQNRGLGSTKEMLDLVSDAILLGADGAPDIADDVTLWGLLIPIRREFLQYVNLRPVRVLPGVTSP